MNACMIDFCYMHCAWFSTCRRSLTRVRLNSPHIDWSPITNITHWNNKKNHKGLFLNFSARKEFRHLLPMFPYYWYKSFITVYKYPSLFLYVLFCSYGSSLKEFVLFVKFLYLDMNFVTVYHLYTNNNNSSVHVHVYAIFFTRRIQSCNFVFY